MVFDWMNNWMIEIDGIVLLILEKGELFFMFYVLYYLIKGLEGESDVWLVN